ncbi:MAG: 50S ribosomal protein L5, partial [Candidatus Shapirobacteria bacterium]|nr:50S ribosomal protein L5 [Candidatus Shapirobacteria bacterium]
MTSIYNPQALAKTLKEQFPKRNIFSLPRLNKVVINYRVSDSRESQEALNAAEVEIMSITGQKPRLCRSKKSIANFKLRENEPLAY